VVVGIYDIAGRRVKTLLSAGRGPGIHTVVWDATDHNGTPVASGVYFSPNRTTFATFSRVRSA
jgi:hypothetical protein